ncbi:MAG: hydrogenase maturation protease [Candidatus Nanopelagicales bacterium]
MGLGSVDRGDDAVGPVVAAAVGQAVAARGLSGVHVIDHEAPTALIELMDDHDVVVIIDAVRSGAAPGTLTVRPVGHDRSPLPARTDPGPTGTHGLGLAGAIELARALDRLPSRVVVVGVEAIHFGHGAPLSAPVLAAVPRAVDAVLGLLRTGLAGTQLRSPSDADEPPP